MWLNHHHGSYAPHLEHLAKVAIELPIFAFQCSNVYDDSNDFIIERIQSSGDKLAISHNPVANSDRTNRNLGLHCGRAVGFYLAKRSDEQDILTWPKGVFSVAADLD